jgi:hypothetical protein
LSPLDGSLWLAVFLLIAVIAVFLPTLHLLGRRHGSVEHTAESFWLGDGLFYVFGAFCQQGAPAGQL